MKWGFVAAILVGAAVSRSASAQEDRSISIELVVPHGDEPDIVCVDSQEAAEQVLASCWWPESGEETHSQKPEFQSEKKRCRQAVEAIKKDADCKVQQQGLQCKETITNAQTKSHLACTINSQRTESGFKARRVLLLKLSSGPYDKVDPQLKGVTLDGNQLLARIEHVTAVRAEAAAYVEVLGGSYQSGAALVSLRGQERATMQITPRILHRKIVLPPSIGDGGFDYQIIEQSNAASCNDSGGPPKRRASGGTVDVDVPFESAGVLVCGPHFTARATWGGEPPPEVIRPRVESIDFSWKPDCLYDVKKLACPTVTLPDMPNLGTCSNKWDGEKCVYTCPAQTSAAQTSAAQTSVAFDLPFATRFDVRNDQTSAKRESAQYAATWKDQVRTAGQILDSFTAPNDRQLIVDPRGWPEPSEVYGERVENVLLWAHDTEAHRLKFRPGKKVVAIPRLACYDQIVYEARGDLHYFSDTVTVGVCGEKHEPCPGMISLPPPHLDEIITIGISAGGGGYLPFESNAAIKLNWYLLAELELRLNLSARGLVQRAWLPRAMSFRIGGLLSDAWADGLATTEPKMAPLTTQALYGRVPVTAHLVYGWRFLHLGLGGGASYGRAWFNSNLSNLPSQLTWIPGSLIASYNAHARLAIEVRAMLFREYSISTTLANPGAFPDVKQVYFWSAFYGGAVTFNL